MILRLSLLFAFCATVLPALRATTPVRYEVEATVDTQARAGREPFGSRFFFATGNQVIYRVLPDNRSDTDPAPNWQYWSPTATRLVLPVAGYESVDVVALNAAGVAVGRSVTENSPTPNPHQEAALDWTAGGGSTIPTGFDAGSSGLKAINASGQAVGFTNGGTYRTVRWDSTTPSSGPGDIIPPAGYGNCEVRGISATGEALLYVSNPGLQNVAIGNGPASTVIGPAPASNETFYPSNCVIAPSGDVAMVFFSASQYRIIFIPAQNREAYQIFTFPGSGSSAYNLQISDAGLASCETSVNGANVVSIVSSIRAQQMSFAGYTSFLNARGDLVFGNQGTVNYWDAAAWTGAPAAVPLALPASPSAPTLAGLNDDGRLLALGDDASQTTRTLSILAPVYPDPVPPANVTLTAVRKTLRLPVEKSTRAELVRARTTGEAPGTIRYLLRGKLPSGLRFRATDGSLLGRPQRAQKTTLRVAATYTSAGVPKQTPFVPINVQIRAPANPPTR